MLLSDINKKTKDEIRSIAIAAYDRNEEACGVACSDGQVVESDNNAADPSTTFKIDGRHLTRRDIEFVWHSHNNGKDEFSPADIVGIRGGKYPHLLHDVVGDRWRLADPRLGQPYLGTQFTYGVHDCWSVVRAWYWQHRGIRLTDYDRTNYREPDGSLCWQNPEWDEFRKYFRAEGFEELPPSEIRQEGDLLLMALHGGNPNHLALVTDPAGEIVIHQRMGRPAEQIKLDGYYHENTVAILRRQDPTFHEYTKAGLNG